MLFAGVQRSANGSYLDSVCLNHLQEAFSKKVTMAKYVIEVTDFKSEVRFDFGGHLASKMQIFKF